MDLSHIHEKLQHLAVPTDRMSVAPENARVHGDDNLRVIIESLRLHGQLLPVVGWTRPDGVIEMVAGSGRLMASRVLATLDARWCALACLEYPTQDAARRVAFALQDNRSGDLATYSEQYLARAFEVVRGFEIPIESLDLGWSDVEIQKILKSQGAVETPTDPDIAVPQNPISRPGDVWALGGGHRVMCGDATSEADVARLCAGARPLLCVTDPPYGVRYNPAWRNVEAAKGNLAYADRRIGEVANDDRADWSAAWALFPGDVIYSWHPAGATSLVHAAALQGSGFAIRMQIIWAKSNFPIGRGDYHVRHEPCWYAVRKGKPARRTDDRTQTTLWSINLDRNVEGGHSTQKPVECMARPIRNHDFREVYDPFIGSGTTLIAAEELGRVCYGMEIAPQYVDVTVARWCQMFNRDAVREADGASFMELRKATQQSVSA